MEGDTLLVMVTELVCVVEGDSVTVGVSVVVEEGLGVGLAIAYTLKSSEPINTAPSLAITGDDRTGPDVASVQATVGANPGEPDSPTTV